MTTTTKRSTSRYAAARAKFAFISLVYFSLGTVLVSSAPSCIAQTALPEGTTATAPTFSTIQAGPLFIGAGDLVDVQVFSTPELSGKLRVDQSGSVNLVMGGVLKVSGLSPAQAGLAIEDRLRNQQIMIAPHVNVLVLEFATSAVTVLGDVRSVGRFNLLGPHSLYDALSAAGGPTVTAGRTITITHQSDPTHPVVIAVDSPNYSELQRLTSVEPGDTIFVSKADNFYVVGDVLRSGAFPMPSGEPLTVLNALALAAGLNHTAAVSKASIVRITPSGAVSIPVDLKRVMKNQDPNLVLQAKDVLVVPRSGGKVFLDTALPSITGAVVSSAATAFIVR